MKVKTEKITKADKVTPLTKLVNILPKSYPSTNIEHDTLSDLTNYLPSASTFEIVDRFSAGLRGAKSGRILSITGPYGSGKSTMVTFLDGLVSPEKSKEWKSAYDILRKEMPEIAKNLLKSREKSEVHKNGLIKCMITAKQEPITVTILRALDTGSKKYFKEKSKENNEHLSLLHTSIKNLKNGTIPPTADIIKIVQDMCKVAPIILVIDEFGKNIEYFTIDKEEQADLFLLQQLAEMSGRSRQIPLFIITLQHMAFEEYAVGASSTRKREWAKIQGRFEDIPFTNSPDQTRQLVYNTIKQSNSEHIRKISQWAKQKSEKLEKIGIVKGLDFNLISKCYPLEPLALEILPELCSRYGQYERTLLSFISDAGKHTVATFIDENIWNEDLPPEMGIDKLYDYFIAGTNMIHSSSAHITRLMEIETIIRDSHGLDDIELKILKTIGILNLIGRSGYLRASNKIIEYAVGYNVQPILKKLSNKSIITYRKYSDEYRIWHGTDIDIAVKLDLYRKRYRQAPLIDMLSEFMSLDPIVAARHSIKKGTIRIFERSFVTKSHIDLNDRFDGVIAYLVDDTKTPTCAKPLITLSIKSTDALRQAIVEVMTIDDILKNDEDVKKDWVVRKELDERLVDAKIILHREFNVVCGDQEKWLYNGKIKNGSASVIISKICDEIYHNAPVIRNEMINKAELSSQGTAARRLLLECMISHTDKPKFGIEGYGPHRAMYEALFFENEIHVNEGNTWMLVDPKKDLVAPAWSVILDAIKNSKGRIKMSEVYKISQAAPFGMREGVSSIFIISILLIHKNQIALYEHGTYVPYLTIEAVERMLKNPDYFEFKYFQSTKSKKEFLKCLIQDFEINSEGSVLNVVSHLVRIVSALPPYVKKTKKLDAGTLALRDSVLQATEPDTLLFESIPKAMKLDLSKPQMASKKITNSKTNLQRAFLKTGEDLTIMLFEVTGVNNREKLSKTARTMLASVTDETMRKFLTAVSTDALEKNDDWINYVAMSITDVPMLNWTDSDRDMFENNLKEISAKFQRLASIHFAKIVDNFVKPSHQITVTRADGSENRNVVSINPEQKKKIENVLKQVLQMMKKEGLANKDMNALIVMLSVIQNRK